MGIVEESPREGEGGKIGGNIRQTYHDLSVQEEGEKGAKLRCGRGIVERYNTLPETKEQRSGMEGEEISGKGCSFQIRSEGGGRGRRKVGERGGEGDYPQGG